MNDKVRTHPFEPAKRRVPYLFYLAVVVPLSFLWLWAEDAEIGYTTVFFVIIGLVSTSKAIARFILVERETHQKLKAMKAEVSRPDPWDGKPAVPFKRRNPSKYEADTLHRPGCAHPDLCDC